LDSSLRSDPGTYALILQSDSNEHAQVGRWGELQLKPGYYIYIGSAFGPGGVKARVARHWRTNKRKHWHIDYLREHVALAEIWVSYEAERFEHQWAQTLLEMSEMTPIRGFGCSDCNCQAHLFNSIKLPEGNWLGKVEKYVTSVNRSTLFSKS
jgi:Uri superfamily endonuclease